MGVMKMKVTLIKDHNYSLDGHRVIAGKKGSAVEVGDGKAKAWKRKGVIADKASKPASPVVEKKVVEPVAEVKEEAPKVKISKAK